MSSFYRSKFGPGISHPLTGYAGNGQYGAGFHQTTETGGEGPPPNSYMDCTAGGPHQVGADGRWLTGPCVGELFGNAQSVFAPLPFQAGAAPGGTENAAASAGVTGAKSFLVHVTAPEAVRLEVIQGWPDGDWLQYEATELANFPGIWRYVTAGVHPTTGAGHGQSWVRHRATYADGTVVDDPDMVVAPNSNASRGGWIVGSVLYRKVQGSRTGIKEIKPAAFAAGAPIAGEDEIITTDDADGDDNDNDQDTESWLDYVPGGGKTVVGVASIVGIGFAGRKLGWF